MRCMISGEIWIKKKRILISRGTMDESRDFIQWLGQDMSLKILMSLSDPCDLVRISAVSISWHQFVVGNALSKKLCLKKFPEVSCFERVIEIKDTVEHVESGTEDPSQWTYLKKEHRVYAFLTRNLLFCSRENCISDAICASSTDNFPDESIVHTLEPPSDRIGHRASYWSSKGEINPSAPETLIYRLASKLCLITEFHVHPFQAYFQFGFPIYSAKAVKFQIGYSKVPLDVECEESEENVYTQDLLYENFVWTYTSPEFPMAQENCLQKFKLPKPVVCVGGILRVELLGRVQTQEMDGLYYICINHVQVMGRPLSPIFDVDMMDERGGKCVLKFYPERICKTPTVEIAQVESSSRSHFDRLSESIRGWEQLILNTLRGPGPVVIDDYDSDFEYLE